MALNCPDNQLEVLPQNLKERTHLQMKIQEIFKEQIMRDGMKKSKTQLGNKSFLRSQRQSIEMGRRIFLCLQKTSSRKK